MKTFTTYLDHTQDMDFIESILNRQPLEELFRQISTVLQDGQDTEAIQETYVFIRDVCIIAAKTMPIAQQFRDQVHDSPVRLALENCLSAPNVDIRLNAAYTLGKIGCFKSLPALWQALRHATEHDPQVLDRLIVEIAGLEVIAKQPSQLSAYFQTIPAHPNYLTRWAIANTLFEREFDKKVLRQLRQDSHEWVRAEAKGKLDPSFELIYMRFRQQVKEAYTIEAFEAFVKSQLG